MFPDFANQNPLRYRAATLREHNTTNYHQTHTKEVAETKQKVYKEQKDSPLVRARKLSFIDNETVLSEDFTEYLK